MPYRAHSVFSRHMRLILLTCVLVSAGTFQATRQYWDSTQWVERAELVLGKSAELLSTERDAEMAARGLLLTGRDSDAASYQAARQRISDQLQQLRELTGNDVRERESADRFAARMEEKLADLALTLQLNRERGWQEALTEVRTDRARKLILNLRAEDARLRSDVEGDLPRHREMLRRDGQRLTWAGGAAAMTVLLLAVFALRLLRRYRIQQQAWEKNLVEQTRRAEKASLAKSVFLTAMSHEIRTPMNAILGMSEMLAESRLDAEQMQYVEVFQRAGGNLLILINDILDLSKIEGGHLELENVDFDLEDVVDHAIEIIGVKSRAKGIGLMSHLAPDLNTALVGDPTRLRQVLINLLGNAVKFSDSGEVVLTVHNPRAGEPGQIEFAISDTGIGIAADKLEMIFHSFTQADSTTTRKYGGTGLGLEISRRLVEKMGGKLTVKSRLGEGSTFWFNAQFGLATARERKGQPATADFRGLRVLVIDDNATNRFILGETLNAWGMESSEFGIPAEALAHLKSALGTKRPYSLVLVDSEMPVMDGFETADRIKTMTPDLPVLMFTSDARPGDVLRRRQAGLAGYAVKPVKRCDLRRLIENALQPRKGAEPRVVATGDCGNPGSVETLRILIAEDSSDNRMLLKAYLKGSPHRFVFVEDGKAAVERFTEEAFDVALLDMQMPVMDGLTAARSIREIERERSLVPIQIIALTANAHASDIELSRTAGCDLHLSKPISKHKLLSAITDCAKGRAGASAEEPADIQLAVI